MEYKEPHKLKLKKIDLKKEQDFHKISCPSCQNEILAADLNINDKIAKCSKCNVVFSFQHTVNNLFTNQPKVKQEIVRPEGIDLFHFREELEITIQQPFPSALVIFTGLMSTMAVLFTILTITKPALFLLITTIFFWIISMRLIYNSVVQSKGKVHISINERLLNMEYRPRKKNKNQSYDRNDIDQLYIRKGTHYGIYMILNGIEGQKHVPLIPFLSSLSKARYLEQEMEKYLGIIDREVLEEIKI